MNKTKTILSAFVIAAVTGVTISGAVLAQDTTPTPAQAEETTTSPASTEPDLDTGQPEEPTVGQGYIREESGDWQIQCVKQDDPDAEACQLYQLLRGAENNPVAEVIIEKLPQGGQVAAGATILVPHGTALSKDLRIAVDGSKGKVYRYAFCDKGACYARIGLLPADIASFKKGSAATVTLFPFERPDQAVELKLSLSGFTAGFDGLQATQAAQ